MQDAGEGVAGHWLAVYVVAMTAWTLELFQDYPVTKVREHGIEHGKGR